MYLMIDRVGIEVVQSTALDIDDKLLAAIFWRHVDVYRFRDGKYEFLRVSQKDRSDSELHHQWSSVREGETLRIVRECVPSSFMPEGGWGHPQE